MNKFVLPFLIALSSFDCLSLAFDAVLTDDTSLPLAGKVTAKAGAQPILAIDAKHKALFKFDLSSIPSGRSSSNVLSATLTVFLSRVSKPGTVGLSRVSGDWDEETIPAVTFSNLPDQIAVIGASAKNNYLRFDVTEVVKSWLNGSIENAGLAIGVDVNGSGVVIGLDSKENSATGRCAKLNIEFSDQPALSQVNRGAWSNATVYHTGDVVSYDGSTWIATASASNSQPAIGNVNWSILAQKGVNGSPGPAGSFLQSYRGTWSAGASYAAGDIVTETGTTYLATAANANSQPSVGSVDWSVLAKRGDVGAKGDTGALAIIPSAVRVEPGAISQDFPPNVKVPLLWTIESFDTDNFHNVNSNSSRLVAPKDGIYLITVSEALDRRVYGNINIWKNGAVTGLLLGSFDKNVGNNWAAVTTLAKLNAGDFIEAIVEHNYTSSIAVQRNSASNFTMHWIRANQ